MNWTGTYLRSTPASAVITKVITITTLKSSGTEVFGATMITVMSDSYDTLESALTHMKNIKLY